jgi:hypothetical protein
MLMELAGKFRGTRSIVHAHLPFHFLERKLTATEYFWNGSLVVHSNYIAAVTR